MACSLTQVFTALPFDYFLLCKTAISRGNVLIVKTSCHLNTYLAKTQGQFRMEDKKRLTSIL